LLDAQLLQLWSRLKDIKLKLSVSGLALGLALGLVTTGFAIPLREKAPTVITWDAVACPAGIATVTSIACDDRNNCYSVITEDVKFPIVGNFQQTFANIPPTNYTVRASAPYPDGANWQSQIQQITGLGDAPVPEPSPTPTVIPKPTVTPTPIPQIPANCTSVQSGKDAAGNTWSIDVGNWLMLVTPDGVSDYAFPGGGSLPGAAGDHLIFNNGIAFIHDNRDGLYYKLLGRSSALKETPVCGVIPTPTPTPTPVIDLKPLVDGITNANALLNQLLGLMTPPVTVTCTITAVSSYTNGDQRLTVRCSPSGFATGQVLTIIKK
jgi:hypothetical protein